MPNLPELISAIADLVWPAVALLFLVMFKKEIGLVLKRLSHIKKGKLLGQEFELGEELSTFKTSAEQIQQEAVVAIPPPLPPDPSAPLQITMVRPDNLVLQTSDEQKILAETGKSPRSALLLISANLEQRLRQLLAATGWHQSIPTKSFATAIDRLIRQGTLPEDIRGAFKLFREIRNKIVHGHVASDEDILSAVDSALVLLRALDAIPTEINVVYQTRIEIFSDAICSERLEGHGLILEVTPPDRSAPSFRIFPTTRDHFKKGKRVAWEWDFKRNWGPAWYKDSSGHVKKAWESAAEFIGRHLDDV